ncbi:MAG: protein kinase, partial [Anaerolineae bacterium]
LSALAEAVELYRGDFLAGFTFRDSPDFDDWQSFETERLRQELEGALGRLVRGHSAQGDYRSAIGYAQRWSSLDPLREAAHRALMELHAWSGDRSAALRQYEACARVLKEEMGVEPSPETTELYQRIYAGERGPAIAERRERVIRGYEIRARVGEGNFGIVYRAYQPRVGREVAVKAILPQYANHPDFIRRFEAEAQVIARLEHPYIVPLYDYWREPDGAYLVMRWLRGGSLGAALERGPWKAEAAARLVDQIAAALAVAHRQGVVHRDIKPANILLDQEGNAYLSDFGIAKDLLSTADLTQTDAITGSPAYISPEQIQEEPVTPLADIYSLGVVLYELLTGAHPFPGESLATLLVKHLNEPLPLVVPLRPDLSPTVDKVIQQATAKDPAERFPDALSLAHAFRQALMAERGAVLTAVEIPLAEPTNPYKGLRPFYEADAADFFGREALTERLLVRLAPSPSEGEGWGGGRFLAVVGPSGSGKSSVVRAGLVPALRRGALPGSENWFVVEMLPGAHPLEELEIGLLRVAIKPPTGLMEQLQRDERGILRAARLALPEEGELLLIIDQFEELFTLVEHRAEAWHFLDSLYAAVSDPRSPLRVVITLRADFFDRPLSHPSFSSLLQSRTEVVVPLTLEELGQAIRGPVERVGVTLEEGLVTAMVAQVNEQPGGLPLLQYALTELFEHRDDRLITQEAYHAVGGVLGALGRRAEALYAELDADGQEAARQLFLRMVILREGIEDVRRRVLRAELKALTKDDRRTPHALDGADNSSFVLPPSSAMDQVIDTFGKARLLTFDRDPVTRGPTVEVAHEALLREWRRLREWLDKYRADVRTQRLLANVAAEWAEAGRDGSFLLRGSRLDHFEGWAAETELALTEDERAFLEASSAERRRREEEQRAQQARELALERSNV